MRAPWILLLLTTASCTSAAAATTNVASSEPRPAIEEVWAARCGGCHRPVEPGTRDRSYLDVALGRHRQRIRMKDNEWTAMLEFLSGPEKHP